MVFPSLPIYLDPPNWSQQQPNQEAGIGIQNNPPSLQPPPPSMAAGGGGGYQGSIRPGSMADRARLAKIHQPDAALKCPRCESTNTKFCYYNNYSLSQPRHFCKTCRRYWTRGGALRNVPVGGGCRRNKRTKGTSKSPMKLPHQSSSTAAGGGGSSSASANSSSNGCTSTTDLNVVIPHLPPPTHQLPFLSSLHHYNNDLVSNFGTTPTSLVARNGNNNGSDIGEFQIGTSSSSSPSVLLSSGIGEQWRLSNLQQVQVHQQQHQQFPFLTNLEPQIGLFQFGGENNTNNNNDGGERLLFNRSNKAMESSCGVISGTMMPPQVNTIKMEENDQGLSLPKNLLSGSTGNDLFWNGNGNAWSEVPSFTPSSSHFL